MDALHKPVVLFLCTGNSARSQMALREYLGYLPVRILIVVCAEAEKSCPVAWPGALARHFWQFDDPAAAQGTDEDKLNKFREARDAIRQRIRSWLTRHATGGAP